MANLIVNSRSYRAKTTNALAYAIFQIWFIAPISPVFYNADEYFAYVETSMRSADYAELMRALFTPP